MDEPMVDCAGRAVARGRAMVAVEEVFDDWNAAIMRSLRRKFRGTPEATLEDGAAFAWMKLSAKPPATGDNILGWLIVVARNEVLELIRRWERPVEILSD